MKKKNFMIAFLMAMTIVLAAPYAAFAEEYSVDDAACSFDGSEISSNFESSDLATYLSHLEPGDKLDYQVTYTNNSGKTTEWYMLNDVLETLEESKDAAENGGYTYVLKNIGPDGTETTYFDNSEVGGETKTGGLEGLHQATNATRDYFFIQQLAPGQSGKTSLHVELDGETQVNDYWDTKGVVRLAYAVEIVEPGQRVIQDGATRTGDPLDLMEGLLVMSLAFMIGLVALLSRRKDRKDGDEA